MKKLLIKESPLLILPSLAVKIGFHEAAVLQQIHFWLTSSKHFIEGHKWIYNTYKGWHKQFPFWSESTIKRTILTLENLGLLISGNWNFSKMDKTKWYTIDYEKVAALELPLFETDVTPPDSCPFQTDFDGAPIEVCIAQLDPSLAPAAPTNELERSVEETKMTQAIPESTSKNSSEKENPIVEIISYLNDKTGSSYKPTTDKTRKTIRSRLREGFTIADFKKVIGLKATEWLHDPYWCKYLRPETLFGTLFESYFNQKGFKKKLNREKLNLDD